MKFEFIYRFNFIERLARHLVAISRLDATAVADAHSDTRTEVSNPVGSAKPTQLLNSHIFPPTHPQEVGQRWLHSLDGSLWVLSKPTE